MISKGSLSPKFKNGFTGIISLCIILAGSGFCLGNEGSAKAEEHIRVLVLREPSRLTITGQDLALVDLKTGRSLFQNRKFPSITMHRGAGVVIRTDQQSAAAEAVAVEALSGTMNVGGKLFRGRLNIYDRQEDIWVINELPLEEYLVGLINYEISSHWMMEAVKAQAVAARTYAVFQRRNRAGELYHLDSNVSDQVYGGAQREDVRSRIAVEQTSREILVHQGTPIFAVYSACCGGKTESADQLWTGHFPYLQSRNCGFCLDAPHFFWNWEISAESLAKSLASAGFTEDFVRRIEIQQRSASQRVLQLAVWGDQGRMLISGKDFRRLLGFDRLRSTQFVAQADGRGFSFSGLGWGHGVGLCQWGAKGLAEAGADYRDILQYYYRGVQIQKIGR